MSKRRSWTRAGWVVCTLAASWRAVLADAPATTQPAATRPADRWAEYRTPDHAITATPTRVIDPSAPAPVGYLGVALSARDGGAVTVERVDAGSPAADAGLAAGDVLIRLGGSPVKQAQWAEEQIHALAPGDTVKLAVRSPGGKDRDVPVTLRRASRPMKLGDRRIVIGVQTKEPPDGQGVQIDRVLPDMPAARAGLKSGDVILDVDNISVAASNLNETLQGHAPEETVSLKVKRGDGVDTVKVKLAAAPRDERDPGYFAGASLWKRDLYRIAVVPIEYPDAKHNEKIRTADWDESLFSTGKYTGKDNATGQPVYGSMNDFYRELSYGKFHVEGKVFDWVEVSKKRADYGQGTGDNANLLSEVLDKLLARDGKDALRDYDGLFFVYAGARVRTTRGGLYWPHKGYTQHNRKRWSFLIVPEGGDKMTNISVCCHEFGHMLGLPDLYARPENPGSEGLGNWCLMSNELGGGRPQHMSAWCKEQLGWLTPATIDPTVKQKLILSPVEDSPKECFKVLVRADGSEYLLLEYRKKQKFDATLPGEGLLIWRVSRNRPTLEESHGVEGPPGPRVFPNSVPFPSAANKSFTPYTTPSSRSLLGGGLPVFITDIERTPDGRIAFCVGYEYF